MRDAVASPMTHPDFKASILVDAQAVQDVVLVVHVAEYWTLEVTSDAGWNRACLELKCRYERRPLCGT